MHPGVVMNGRESTSRTVAARGLLPLLAAVPLVAGCIHRNAASPSQSGTASPEIYGPGVFTTADWDFFIATAPDSKTVVFCRADTLFERFTILQSDVINGRIGEAKSPSFATGEWSDADPHFTVDGRRLFFISNRPVVAGSSVARKDYDIWYVDRSADGTWGSAVHLPAPVNADGVTEWSPTVAKNGNLYFGAVRAGGRGGNDIYVSRLVRGVYQTPENVGDSINTNRGEIEPWIAPDESYMIFSGNARTDNVGQYDLYISFRRNGVFQRAQLMRSISSPAMDFNQSVSPDGKWLYFSSTRPAPANVRDMYKLKDGLGDIYRVRFSDAVAGLNRG
jgi:Tol biopolymer transport system component